jgi:hypothetical protein
MSYSSCDDDDLYLRAYPAFFGILQLFHSFSELCYRFIDFPQQRRLGIVAFGVGVHAGSCSSSSNSCPVASQSRPVVQLLNFKMILAMLDKLPLQHLMLLTKTFRLLSQLRLSVLLLHLPLLLLHSPWRLSRPIVTEESASAVRYDHRRRQPGARLAENVPSKPTMLLRQVIPVMDEVHLGKLLKASIVVLEGELQLPLRAPFPKLN